jgi:hypothetical protein
VKELLLLFQDIKIILVLLPAVLEVVKFQAVLQLLEYHVQEVHQQQQQHHVAVNEDELVQTICEQDITKYQNDLFTYLLNDL